MSIIKPHNKKSNQIYGEANKVYAASSRAVAGSATQRGLWNAFLKLLTRAESNELIENRKADRVRK
jgi:hypothetical protein